MVLGALCEQRVADTANQPRQAQAGNQNRTVLAEDQSLEVIAAGKLEVKRYAGACTAPVVACPVLPVPAYFFPPDDAGCLKMGCTFRESMGGSGAGFTGLAGRSRVKESPSSILASASSSESTISSASAINEIRHSILLLSRYAISFSATF